MKKEFTGNVYEDAITKWGENAQFDQLVEEMAELTLAVSKYKRQFNDSLLPEQRKNVMDNLFVEIADVKLMIEEMEFMFGKENVDKAYEKQLKKFKLELYGEEQE